MEKPQYITFDNIIIKVDSIVDVERPNNADGTKTHVVVNLSSGRSIDTTCPTEAVADARYKMFMDLLNPQDWDVLTPAQ